MNTVPQPHPVSRLLTDEMKARVRAATFVSSPRDGMIVAVAPNGHEVCPLGIALGWTEMPGRTHILESLGSSEYREPDRERRAAVFSFTGLSDNGRINPADVYALLDCLPDDASRPPAETTERGS